MKLPRLFLLTISLCSASSIAHAQWVANGTAICTALDHQNTLRMVPDGQGGAIIVWVDYRSPTPNNPDIYAQRVNKWGFVQWAANGIAVCSDPSQQGNPEAVSDGLGGAIVVWQDGRIDGGIYAQRVDANGNALWTSGGVIVNNEVGLQQNAKAVSDGAGGAIVVWEDSRNFATSSWDVYAQRIDYNGQKLWTPAGMVVCTHAAAQTQPVTVSDGQQGVIVMWDDQRNMATQGEDQYIQRLNGASLALWGPDGVPVAASPASESFSSVASDGFGGVLCAWVRQSAGTSVGTYVQRVNSSGAAQWAANGQMLCNTVSYFPAVIDDELGGAIVAWDDFRSPTFDNVDLYAARYTDAGFEWGGSNGQVIVDAPTRQSAQPIIPLIHNAPGQWMIAWTDSRNGATDIYAHLHDIDSNPFWQNDGVPVTQAADDQSNPVMVPDGAGGALIAWEDRRTHDVTDTDVYAIRIDGNGAITGVRDTPPAATALRIAPNVPNPFNGFTKIRFDLASASRTTLEIFDVAGRRMLTKELGSLGAGSHMFSFDGRDNRGRSLPSGEYFYRVTAAGTARSGKFVLTR